MALTLYRRHTRNCKHRKQGQNCTKCSCPIWCDGDLNGKRCRKALKLRDWNRAVRRVEKWENEVRSDGTQVCITTIKAAVESYLGDCRARNLKGSTITSYAKTLAELRQRPRLHIHRFHRPRIAHRFPSGARDRTDDERQGA